MEKYTQITLDQWVQWKEDIKRKLQETAGNFVYIGYRLKQIRDSGMYDGCDNVFDFAKKEFGLERTTVSRFMAINDKFSKHGNSIELRDEFVGLGQSQLSEMLSLPVSDYDLITEDTAVKDIRELKRFEKDMNEPEAEPEEPKEAAGEKEEATENTEEYTPLQKCIIDFFKDKQELLKEVANNISEEEKVAEIIAPSGCVTHKKGIIFLFMYDYGQGVKYKQMGKPEPVSMTWEEFIAEIDRIFIKGQPAKPVDVWDNAPQEEKTNVCDVAQDEVQTEARSEAADEEEGASKAAGQEETNPAAAGQEETNPAAAGDDDVKIYDPEGKGNSTLEQIQLRHDNFFEMLEAIKAGLECRNWSEARDWAGRLQHSLGLMEAEDPDRVEEALDVQFDDD